MTIILGGSRVLRRGRMTLFFISLVVGWLCALTCAQTPSAPADAANREPAARAAELRAEIARHDELYFKKAAPEISDAAYDRLKQELAACERQLGISPDSGGVGDDRDGRFPTARHGRRMLSLQKVYTEKELTAFAQRTRASDGSPVAWVLEPKYDGLAITATYENGRLTRVVTRGDGHEGDDVSQNARAIAGLPSSLAGADWPRRIELRGEVYVTVEDFTQVNAAALAAGENTFAHPRALAAGSLKLADPGAVAARRLSVVFHGWGEVIPAEARPSTQRDFHVWIARWGLPAVASVRLAKTATELREHVRAFGRERLALPFPTDGVVIKIDDVSRQEALGVTEQAPRWAVAYKFSTSQAETRVRAITLQVGRTGALTPVAELEPVELGGSTIRRATLHNAANLAARDVRIGDTVVIEKAGEIIPTILGVERTKRPADSQPFLFPEKCPVCAAVIARSADAGGLPICPNRACAAQVEARLRHFTGPQAVAITGLGEATLEALVASGVTSPAQLYRMSADDWSRLPGVGKKTAEKLAQAVHTSKTAALWRHVHGLGIPTVGTATARTLADRFPTLTALAEATREELAGAPRISAAQAEAIATFFADPQNRALVTELVSVGVVPASGVRP
jgi:DNA ligase (NAD+)